VLNWFKQTIFAGKSYDELSFMAKQEEGKRHQMYLYPYFVGAGTPHHTQEIKGFLYGLDLNTTVNQIVRSVFEGVAYQIKENMDVMEEVYRSVRELRVFGGGSKSDVWCQVISDITDKPVITLYTSEVASLGAAIPAGLGTGRFKQPQEAFEFIKVKNVFEPQKDAVENYKGQYQEYHRIQQKIMR
jgi:xylulokinase